MLQTKAVQKIKTHTLCSTILPRKSFHFWDNMGKYGGASQPTGENTIRRMRTACWI